MIRVSDLTVKLMDFRLYIKDLEIADSEYFIIMGPSGVGKTVLLHTLAGFIKPSGGRIFIDGGNVTSHPPEKRGITIIPQDYGLFPHMNVFSNIAYGLRMRRLKREEVRRRVYEIVEVLEIEKLLYRSPSMLSGGEKQRVAFARALVVKPKVILLDEPYSNLDPKLRATAKNFMKGLREKIKFTAVHVTHDISEAIELGDRIAYIEEGVLKGIYKPPEFLRSEWAKPYLENFEAILRIINKSFH